jgi:hypothetical protein
VANTTETASPIAINTILTNTFISQTPYEWLDAVFCFIAAFELFLSSIVLSQWRNGGTLIA